MGAPDKLQMNTVTHLASKSIREKINLTCHHCKKPGHNRNEGRQLKEEKEQTEGTKKSTGSKIGGATNSNVNNSNNNNNNNKYDNNNRSDGKPRTVYQPYETCCKTNHSSEECYFVANVANRPPPE